MHSLPRKRKKVDLDAEPPEKWQELDRLERQAALTKLIRKKPTGTTTPDGAVAKTVRAKERITLGKELDTDV